ncbi:class I SAM-dependent methyltransferase [Ahrensia sp. R2A130]|uniref:class I SAM-dependent methyltransferase n=1 Tax=Ahrensia sp. R2A130 TaxID=744979 RepID=UPI0018DE7A73|nr:class I SAM-dependent methyltransferase [Ahrensia sp. R2A130]
MTTNMPDTEGEYVLDAPYTWSYFEYQNPLKMSFIANLNGFAAPSVIDDFSYCDLGCGNGVSVNLLAPMFPTGDFHGVDFNAEHIVNANELATAGGLSNTTFIDASFGDYADGDPPMFDFLALHGIYSWVSEDVRVQIRDLIDRTLKPGGLVYVCYNTLPGWSELIPLWRMMQSYSNAESGTSVERAQKALQTIAAVRDGGARYFKDNPSASTYLDRLMVRDPNYVAHEFCNQIFEPMYFEDVANGMKNLGLDFAGTMKTHRNDIDNVLSPDLQTFADSAANETEAEARRSLMRNEFFRRDLYIRDGLRLTPDERNRALSAYELGAKKQLEPKRKTASLGRRTLDLQSSEVAALRTKMMRGSQTVGQFIEKAASSDLQAAVNIAIDLVGTEEIQPIMETMNHEHLSASASYKMAHAINRTCLDQILDGEGRCYLMAPKLGCAYRVGFMEGRLLKALNGVTFQQAVETVAIEIVEGNDPFWEKHGFGASEKGVARLKRKANEFFTGKLAALNAGGVIEQA